MNHYTATGEDLDKLENLLKKHEIETHRYKHIEYISFQTEESYERIQEICGEYKIEKQTIKETYDTKE